MYHTRDEISFLATEGPLFLLFVVVFVEDHLSAHCLAQTAAPLTWGHWPLAINKQSELLSKDETVANSKLINRPPARTLPKPTAIDCLANSSQNTIPLSVGSAKRAPIKPFHSS